MTLVRKIFRSPLAAPAAILFALLIFGACRFPNFLSPRVLMNLPADNSFLGIIAIGMTLVIITGGIDLSVGAMMGLTSILTAVLSSRFSLPLPLVFGIPLVIGAIFGSLQGVIIAKFRLQPLLVTLAGLFLCRGAALALSRESIQISDPSFVQLANWSIPMANGAKITIPTVVFLVALGLGAHVLARRKLGRNALAIGGQSTSARLMGLPVERTLISTYMISGFCSALGGIVFALYTSSGNALAGTGLELDTIAAVVIGGTLLTGGVGSIWGTVLGIAILGTVQNLITFDGSLSSWWSKIFTGSLLLVFVHLQRWPDIAIARKLPKPQL